MNNARIVPSIASAEQLNIGREIDRIGKWKYLHLDIEDGNFVPNITFGVKTWKAISEKASQEIDAHILAWNPENYIADIQKCGVKRIAVHYETMMYPLKVFEQIRVASAKPGLALNFTTPASAVLPFTKEVDYVLVMTAEPDGRGEKFYAPMIEKIKELKRILPEHIEIWADGGITEKEYRILSDIGVNTVIMGRQVFKSEDPEKELNRLMELL